MNYKKFLSNNILSKILIIISFFSFSLVFLLDLFYWKTNVLAEAPPDLSYSHLFRSVLILSGVLFSYTSLYFWKKKNFKLLLNSGTLFEKWSVILIILISLGFLALFLKDPILFNSNALEDHIIEWLSFFFLFCNSMIFVWIFIKKYKIENVPPFSKILFILLAVVFFLIAMEEISWFQRVFELKTPLFFIGNSQQEINFHNYYTNLIENIYYFGAFLFLVIFTFLEIPFPKLRRNKVFSPFIPSPYIAVLGTLATSYNYDMWNIIFTQISFYSSIIILTIFYYFLRKWENGKIFIFSILIFLLNQYVFIVKGETFIRSWDVTEYKELFIPLAFFIYSVSFLRKTYQKLDFV